jgi:hypothetical protein
MDSESEDEDIMLLLLLLEEEAAVDRRHDHGGGANGCRRLEQKDLDDIEAGAAPAVEAGLAPTFVVARAVTAAALNPEAFRRRYRITVDMFQYLADVIKEDVCAPYVLVPVCRPVCQHIITVNDYPAAQPTHTTSSCPPVRSGATLIMLPRLPSGPCAKQVLPGDLRLQTSA